MGLESYTVISARIPRLESVKFKDYCQKKGISPSHLIRDLINREMKVPLPNIVAGKNTMEYSKDNDSFSWFIELDNKERIEVLRDIKPEYLEDLKAMIDLQIEERDAFIGKSRKDSVPVPGELVRRGEG